MNDLVCSGLGQFPARRPQVLTAFQGCGLDRTGGRPTAPTGPVGLRPEEGAQGLAIGQITTWLLSRRAITCELHQILVQQFPAFQRCKMTPTQTHLGFFPDGSELASQFSALQINLCGSSLPLSLHCLPSINSWAALSMRASIIPVLCLAGF